MGDAAVISADLAIGCKVSLLTEFDEEITGIVFAYDEATECLMLTQPGTHGGVNNLRLLKKSVVKKVLHAEPPAEPPQKTLPFVDLERAKQREKKALAQAELDMTKVGVGVTKEAQSVFDALSKTMPCKWQDKTIVVMEAVLVPPPYTVDKCAAKDAEHKGALDRVKKVLKAERQRLGLA
eukprot:jgi/Chrzof1/3934/Cz13g14020.t1